MRFKLLLFCPLFLFLFRFSSTAQVITTVAGNGSPGFSGDGGLATTAQFNNPISVALDAAGNMYVADFYNHRIRKINKTTGIITSLAGTGTQGFAGDGAPATAAQLNNPTDICVDPSGNIYFIDNNNFRIRKIDAVTGIISTVVGNGGGGYAGETTLAVNAGIHYANGLAIDATNLYFSLFSSHRICKLNLVTGIMSSIGGNGINAFAGDGGPATNASFGYPAGLSVSGTGEIYVADYNNSRIRKIDAAGIVTTVAGTGVAGFSGDGGLAISAKINFPTGVFVDAAGNIFIADRNNYRIRKITAATGFITTVAGSGNFGYGGDGGSATSACSKLADPHKVRVDAAGNIYIADQSNSRIRKVDTSPVVNTPPTITISSPATTNCAGSPVTITAVAANAGSNFSYQWKVNGINAGTNNAVFSSSSLNNGDVISCELIVTGSCGTETVISNPVPIAITPLTGIFMGLAVDKLTSCEGETVTFTAHSSDDGPTSSFQWKLNGNNVGTNSVTYTINTLRDADQVTCTRTSTLSCINPNPATPPVITVQIDVPVTPSVSITASATHICAGNTVTFTATNINCGNNPVYQWKINGINAGINNPVFTSSTLNNADKVSCSILVDPTLKCVRSNTANSNEVMISVSSSPAPSISIVASDNNICPGNPINFTATALNAGNSFSYQWKLNGVNIGTNNPVYSSSGLANGDELLCILAAPNADCPLPAVASNKIIMSIKPSPEISITPANPSVMAGTQLELTATVTGSIASYQWSPANLLENSGTLTPRTLPLNANTTFSFTATNMEGCSASKQVAVIVRMPLMMPSAFTPDGDGLNDLFRIPPNTLLELTDFSIYDRWGNKIFSTNQVTKGWDGTHSGKALATDVFVYTVSGMLEGKKIFLKGGFVLIR